jgi:hypothetical protein
MMKGFNPRRSDQRSCKDAIFFIKKENSPDFAICVLDGNGKSVSHSHTQAGQRTRQRLQRHPQKENRRRILLQGDVAG